MALLVHFPAGVKMVGRRAKQPVQRQTRDQPTFMLSRLPFSTSNVSVIMTAAPTANTSGFKKIRKIDKSRHVFITFKNKDRQDKQK